MDTENEMEWNGFAMKKLRFEERDAVLIEPHSPQEERKWAIYTEYFGAFPNTAIGLLENGCYLAFLENQNRWGLEEDQDARHRFLLFLHEEYGLAAQCIPIGMSCGGLHAIKYAAQYPGDVEALYLDAPVVNLLSCPMGFGRSKKDDAVIEECLSALGMGLTEMLSYRAHPLDGLSVLAENKIPVIMLYGDLDEDVPYEENGALLERLYREKNAPIQVIGKPGCGHHPHGLEDPRPILTFLLSGGNGNG